MAKRPGGDDPPPRKRTTKAKPAPQASSRSATSRPGHRAAESPNGVGADRHGDPRVSDVPDVDEVAEATDFAEVPCREPSASYFEETEDSAGDDAILSRTQSVLGPCRALLSDALGRLRSNAGVLFGVEGPRQLSLLASVGLDQAGGVPHAERAALSALEANRPLVAPAGIETREKRRLLAVPCPLNGDVPAVLVAATRPQRDDLVERDIARLGSTFAIALAADRARIHFTLECRMAEADTVRRQLDAYAVDLRSVYLSERSRSDELARALVQLEETYEATVRGLAVAVEAKDEYTGGHLFRVCGYGMTTTAIVAPDHRDDPQFEYGFLLHDIGKLAVPDAVLAKTGTLTAEEWEHIRAHPVSGRTILERIPFLIGASEIVYCHHERWDGSGFPRGLRGEEIPLGARIFPIADAFDAMTTSRPYREAVAVTAAREEIRAGSGSQFWPDAVDAFLSIPVEDLEEIRRRTLGASGW
jgi:cyclic di-GMP phosphodiesterase